MSYESPIEVITSQMRISSERTISGEIMKAVRKVGINVDKAELLRALAHDRGQYEKGYADGRADRDEEIVRCKDCKHGEPGACGDGVDCDGVWHDDDWFCADGVAKDINVPDKEGR